MRLRRTNALERSNPLVEIGMRDCPRILEAVVSAAWACRTPAFTEAALNTARQSDGLLKEPP
jgi:hypothetical protein